jgi:hypothetical protein
LNVIELIQDAPEGVLAFKAVGDVQARDYEEVLKPAINEVLARGGGIRIVYEIGPEFGRYSPGAAWDDMVLGFAHLTKWERCAVVTDRDWVEHLAKGFGWLMSGRLRVFGVGELSAAMKWAAADE